MKKYILVFTIAVLFFPLSLFSGEDPCQDEFETAYNTALSEYNSDLDHCNAHPLCVDEATAAYNEAIIDALDEWRDCKGYS